MKKVFIVLLILLSMSAFSYPKGSHKSDYGHSNSHRRGTNTGIPGLSFSFNRAVGITSTKQRFARATGIPTSRQGRQAKIGRMIGIK